ncbi:MAG: hypothetical protein ACYCOU_04540 [Sulfobacillus sp.]
MSFDFALLFGDEGWERVQFENPDDAPTAGHVLEINRQRRAMRMRTPTNIRVTADPFYSATLMLILGSDGRHYQYDARTHRVTRVHLVA